MDKVTAAYQAGRQDMLFDILNRLNPETTAPQPKTSRYKNIMGNTGTQDVNALMTDPINGGPGGFGGSTNTMGGAPSPGPGSTY